MSVDRSPTKTRSLSIKLDSPMASTDVLTSLKNLELKFDEFGKKFDKLDKKINSKFAELSSKVGSIEGALTSQIKELELQLQTQINTFVKANKEIEDKFIETYKSIEQLDRALDGRLNVVEEKLDSRLDCIERHIISTDLVIRGIPDLDTENLNLYFNKIATTISFSTNRNENIIDAIYRVRMNNRNNRRIKSTPIIIKCSTTRLKQEFFTNYFKFKSLNLSHIGFDVTTRIYINESLTKRNHNIFRNAIKLKSEFQLNHVSTRNGLVCIKQQENDDYTTINNMQAIEKLRCQLVSQRSSTRNNGPNATKLD